MSNSFKGNEDFREDPFAEYYRHGNPSQVELAEAWQTAIGLQDVDGLKTSKYLITTARRTIEGDISLEKARHLVDSYYIEHPHSTDNRVEEADKVSTRITQLLSEPGFSFSAAQYQSIHERLFSGIYTHAGKFRDYNITKKEWVLDGETVTYANAYDLMSVLEYDLKLEKEHKGSHRSIDQQIEHLSQFVARLWQIHPFGEGNTRTTAVFLIKYLRSRGFRVNNVPFAEHAWYFRNALVRANYENAPKGIQETTEYLNTFLRNALLDESNTLSNRRLHVRWHELDAEKQDIGNQKQDIRDQKQDIDFQSLSTLNQAHARKLFGAFGFSEVFSRKDIMRVLGLTASPASALIVKLKDANLLAPIHGQGKGKYKFASRSNRLTS